LGGNNAFFLFCYFFLSLWKVWICGQKKEAASGNPVYEPCDLLKEIGTCFHHPFREFIIAHLIGYVIQPLQGYPRTQAALNLGQ
jgi:hypothetical protein